MIVFLNDGKEIEINDGASAFDLAVELSIAKKAIAAKINGMTTDLTTKLQNKDTVNIITKDDPEALQMLRHGMAHVLAAAIFEIDEKAEFAIGPAIDVGFYYDIKSSRNFSTEDFEEIESKMRELIKAKLPFEKMVLPRDEAIALFEKFGQRYKIELINDLDSDVVGVYKIGRFVDLCKGPHIPNTSYISEDSFKLTAVAGAYWRGDSKNDMLQRIYGTYWHSKKEMEEYFRVIEEAQARDHRKLGPELEIFHIDETAPGNIFWLRNGTILFNLIKEHIGKVIKKYGYFQVQTPQLLSKSLWETSGHWEKFRENMFIVEDEDKETMAIKPMNCPAHIIIYKNGPVKSYRDLPMRMAEFGLCHRNESSGSLHGLMRLRAFMQDDGHIFCTPEQIVSETINTCAALKEIYSAFGFTDISVKFSDRPMKRAGVDEVWDLAEKSLTEAADAAGLTYSINKGEGAFYGPKLEFVLKDCLGRDWQCGTLQVDFVLPERFDISYIDTDGQKKRPVMLHRALVGSLERFIGILIEHYSGRFPFWLAPVQIVVASITEDSAGYALEVQKHLEDAGFRTEIDTENEKITYKIREHSLKKVPAIVILGKNEMEGRTISVRMLGDSKTETMSLDAAFEYFSKISDGSLGE